jgi:hypothetical protein
MRPRDFLKLTTYNDDGIEKISKDEFADSPGDFKKGTDPRYRPDQYNMPFLNVTETGFVRGHEGRHRAAMVMRSGGNVFPLAIYMKSDIVYSVSWKELRYSEIDDEYLDDEHFTKYFSSFEDANSFEKEMKQKESGDIAMFSIKQNNAGGDYLKGHPERSEPWNYSNWKKEEFPGFLIGQFDTSIRIPRSAMRIVPVNHPTRKK